MTPGRCVCAFVTTASWPSPPMATSSGWRPRWWSRKMRSGSRWRLSTRPSCPSEATLPSWPSAPRQPYRPRVRHIPLPKSPRTFENIYIYIIFVAVHTTWNIFPKPVACCVMWERCGLSSLTQWSFLGDTNSWTQRPRWMTHMLHPWARTLANVCLGSEGRSICLYGCSFV